jgi:aminoethylphosphonate catabolism LysR family transcriptional regulator
MNFTQLRAFDAVARTRGFSRAGQELGLSQPAVTIQVRSLEQQFGVQLFRRLGRQVELTELGQRLYGHTRRLFGIEAEALELLQSGRELLSGEIGVAADGPYAVMGLVSRFQTRHPDVRVQLRLGNSQECIAELVAQRVDLALAAEIPPSAHLHAVPYLQQPLVLLLPAGHPWAGREDLALEQLAGVGMVMREPESNTRRMFEALLLRRQVKVRVALELGSREAVREAVASGLGIAVVLENEIGTDPRLRVAPLERGTIVCTDYLACLSGQADRRVVAAFFALAGGETAIPAPARD